MVYLYIHPLVWRLVLVPVVTAPCTTPLPDRARPPVQPLGRRDSRLPQHNTISGAAPSTVCGGSTLKSLRPRATCCPADVWREGSVETDTWREGSQYSLSLDLLHFPPRSGLDVALLALRLGSLRRTRPPTHTQTRPARERKDEPSGPPSAEDLVVRNHSCGECGHKTSAVQNDRLAHLWVRTSCVSFLDRGTSTRVEKDGDFYRAGGNMVSLYR